MARFHVNESFAIESRSLFVLAGNVVEGAVLPGMVILVPLNSQLSLSAAVHSIEIANGSDGREGLRLCILCADSEELTLWSGLGISDEELEVTPSEGLPPGTT